MSHSAERKEKDCLNCGTTVQGKYCHVCGQENIEPKETFLGMVSHFFNDITHFDGKFFTTLKDLVLMPGFLSAEYVRGRRASYLNPVRMYVFTSAIFFLIFFSVSDPKKTFQLVDNEVPMSLGARDSLLEEIKKELASQPDDINLQEQMVLLKDTSQSVSYKDLLPFSGNFINTIGYNYKTRKEYDSIQQSRPPEKQDGWLKAIWNKRAVYVNEKYRQRSLSLASFFDALMHKLPYLLFVSLPFFALILKLLYIRRKQFYCADHGIFSIHHYILSFILLLFVFLWDKMDKLTGWAVWEVLIILTLFAWPIYLFLAMKRFYRQSIGKTIIKFVFLNITGIVLLLILLMFFLLFSVFQL